MITHIAAKRPGRNDPCHCGSGKKYKRCCGAADDEADALARKRASQIRGFSYEEAPAELMALRERTEREQRGVREYLARNFGVLINVVKPVEFEGRTVWAIGSRIYHDSPPNQTFHEFMLGVLRGELGRNWAEAQAVLDPAEQHYLYRSFADYAAWTGRIAREREPSSDGFWDAPASGSAAYLLSVAWDLTSLLHATKGGVPGALLERLREGAEFQGARYELAVAALFARLDCAIEFLDDGVLRDRKHGEFVATERSSGLRLVVEAKSRHRGGVINEPGEHVAEGPLRGEPRGVRSLITKAIEKDAEGLPFLIFIDYNAPAADPGRESAWMTEVPRMVERRLRGPAQEPASFSALYVTNFSPHYQGPDVARTGEWICIEPRQATAPVAPQLIGRVNYALDRFDRVPDITASGRVR